MIIIHLHLARRSTGWGAIDTNTSIEESLLVLRGLGIQTTSSASTYLSTASIRFIPTTAIQDIFIHEAFKGFEVRFYLAIVVEGEEDLVVVFPVERPFPTMYRLIRLIISRIFSPASQSSNRFGVVRDLVCMSKKLEPVSELSTLDPGRSSP